jgi:hypothetical protein
VSYVKTAFIVIAVIVIVGVAVVYIVPTLGLGTTSLKDINSNFAAYDGKVVTIQGKFGFGISFSGTSPYTLIDNSGYYIFFASLPSGFSPDFQATYRVTGEIGKITGILGSTAIVIYPSDISKIG